MVFSLIIPTELHIYVFHYDKNNAPTSLFIRYVHFLCLFYQQYRVRTLTDIQDPVRRSVNSWQWFHNLQPPILPIEMLLL